jgi:excisionase family DNA binding protein
MSIPVPLATKRDLHAEERIPKGDDANLLASIGKEGVHSDVETTDESILDVDAPWRRSQNVEFLQSEGSAIQNTWLAHEDVSVSKLLVTVTEAGRVLAISRSKVYELMDAGYIPSVNIGRSRRIRVSDLESFVASGERP